MDDSAPATRSVYLPACLRVCLSVCGQVGVSRQLHARMENTITPQVKPDLKPKPIRQTEKKQTNLHRLNKKKRPRLFPALLSCSGQCRYAAAGAALTATTTTTTQTQEHAHARSTRRWLPLASTLAHESDSRTHRLQGEQLADGRAARDD